MSLIGINKIKHSNNFLDVINIIVDKFYYKKESYYKNLSFKSFNKIKFECQQYLNEINLSYLTLTNTKNSKLSKIFNGLLYQKKVYLRISRPFDHNGTIDNIGLHRESFFGNHWNKAINVWTPLKNPLRENSIQYIENSNVLKKSDIILEKENNLYVKKNSASHKTGLNYLIINIKKIKQKNINEIKTKRMFVKKYHSCFFDGNYIHGNAINLSPKIRFSYDFKILRKNDYKKNQNKVGSLEFEEFV